MKTPSIQFLDPQTLKSGAPVPRLDYHLHTTHTDGKSTIRHYLDRAIELGLTEIGFPEHCNMKTTWITTFVPELLEERKRVADRLTVHWGIEAKGSDREGTIAAKPSMLEAAEYVFGAFHSSLTKTPFPELPKEEAAEMETDVLLGLIRKRSCHVIAHPGGLSQKYVNYYPNELYDRVAEAAGKHDIVLELNSGYGADLAFQIDTCIKYGVRVTLGSNAHEVGELGEIVTALDQLRK